MEKEISAMLNVKKILRRKSFIKYIQRNSDDVRAFGWAVSKQVPPCRLLNGGSAPTGLG
jgi:hypothetical protein